MWDYTGYANYHGMNTGVTKRFDKNYMFSVFYVWSKALGTGNSDWATRYPYSDKETNDRVNYSYLDYDRPHNFVINAIYQVPKFVDNRAGGILLNEWQLSGVYRWNSGRPYTIGYSRLSGDLMGGTNYPRAHRRHLRPGQRARAVTPTSSSTPPASQAPSVGSKGDESARYFTHMPAINNVDMSLSKSSRSASRRSSSCASTRSTSSTTRSSRASTARRTSRAPGSSTITNLPYNAAGQLVNQTGFGTINGVTPPRTIQLVTRFTF